MMTGRERVLVSLNHEEPDKVPIDFRRVRGLEEEARVLKESTDYVIVGDRYCG